MTYIMSELNGCMSSRLPESYAQITLYEFTSSGILCTNHINCRDQLCANLDTGELIQTVTTKPINLVDFLMSNIRIIISRKLWTDIFQEFLVSGMLVHNV